MPQNTLPSGIHDLLGLATRMLAGRETHGPWLRLGTAEEFGCALAAMRTAESAFATARTCRAEVGRRGAAADAALTAWLAKARLVLMLALGGEWSERWLASGFTHRGTNVPKRLGARIELARRVVEFLESHPEYAVPFANVTASGGRALHEEITTSAREMREAACEAGGLKRIRDAAEKHLRWKMRGTVGILSVVLDKSDPRWLAFGLNMPKPDAPARKRPVATMATAQEVAAFVPQVAEPFQDVA